MLVWSWEVFLNGLEYSEKTRSEKVTADTDYGGFCALKMKL